MNNLRRLPQDPLASNQAEFVTDHPVIDEPGEFGVLLEWPDALEVGHAVRDQAKIASICIRLDDVVAAILSNASMFEDREAASAWADAFEDAANEIRTKLAADDA